jgi:hypothetical protein
MLIVFYFNKVLLLALKVRKIVPRTYSVIFVTCYTQRDY